jgi:hypothetical protein
MASIGTRGNTTDGSWRPDTPFLTSDGLKVTLRRAAHLTPNGILKTPMRFQVPPMGDFGRPRQYNWSTFDTIAAGQHSRPMGAQLEQIAVDTMLMDRLAAEATSGIVVWDGAPYPQRILKELYFIAGVDDDRKGPAAPFRLTISQPAIWGAPVVDMVATLTDVTPTQRSGHIATEFVSLSFLRYGELAAGEQRRHQRPATKHTLTDNDTLYKIAIKFLHQASKWRTLADHNGITGVSPDSASELAAWAKKHHKTQLKIPTIELVARLTGDPTFSTGLG